MAKQNIQSRRKKANTKLKLPTPYLRSWHARLVKMANRLHDPELLEHLNKVSTELPYVNPSAMTTADAMKAFDLEYFEGPELWEPVKVDIKLPQNFLSTLKAWEVLTKHAKSRESQVRYKLDVLINFVYQQLNMNNLLEDGPPTTLAHETSLSWGPIMYNNEPHICVGRADCGLFFGEKDHMSCYVVMIEVKQNGSDSLGQLLTYMAMVQADRKKRGQTDWTVYGLVSDGHIFAFYRLDMEKRFTCTFLQASREGWDEIASMLASFIIEARRGCSSPVRSSLASKASVRSAGSAGQGPSPSPQIPPLAPLPSIESMMEDA